MMLLLLSVFLTHGYANSTKEEGRSGCVVEKSNDRYPTYKVKVGKQKFVPQSDGITGSYFTLSKDHLLLVSTVVEPIILNGKAYGAVAVNCKTGKVKGLLEGQEIEEQKVTPLKNGFKMTYDRPMKDGSSKKETVELNQLD
jgi:hypothetical protein